MSREDPQQLIAELDDEHQRIATLAAELRHTADRAQETTWLEGYDRLVESMRAHFDHEERLMQTHGYADRAQHQASHRRLIASARECRDRISEGAMSGEAISGFLLDWVHDHFAQGDLGIKRMLYQELLEKH